MPLIVRGPDMPAGVTRSELALNNDLAPSFAELAGVDPPNFVDGRSLAPLLLSEPSSAEWRTAFMVAGVQGTLPDGTPRTSKAVVSTRKIDVAGNRLDQDPTRIGLQRKKWFFTVSPATRGG